MQPLVLHAEHPSRPTWMQTNAGRTLRRKKELGKRTYIAIGAAIQSMMMRTRRGDDDDHEDEAMMTNMTMMMKTKTKMTMKMKMKMNAGSAAFAT